ncbi:hypothetical protein JCM10914A_42210 [Paenibacillus sp. JCM 10914]|uniref:helix-turn-helix domain-containing protein n=1 Tax=Paenibacillus sp. JCM 10914 TaxID=1236974 RepID=UPI0003CC9B9C|nr:helix-turn-helix domain-containing protein [Paenibacillus sp. JCM 10914]GAE05437.1 hypothetical protein JCM10914_1538 [Paenibacillus sp. JCM 10914]
MKHYRIIGENNWFIRLLIPYVLIVILALSTGGMIYQQTLSLVGEEARNNNMHMLEQVRSTLDGRLAEIDTMVTQVANDPKLVQLQKIKEPFEHTNTFKLLAARKSLYNFSVSNTFILDYLVVYRNSDVVIAPSLLYKSDAFYELILNYDKLSYEQWHRVFFEENCCKRFLPAMQAIYKNKSRSIVTYSYPLGSSPIAAQGSVVVLIDNEQVNQLLKGLAADHNGWAYIADENGNVISSIGDYIEFDPNFLDNSSDFIPPSAQTNGNMITHIRSDENGWYYVLAQSPHIVLEKVDYIKRITISMAIVFLIMGMILAYLFTVRNSRKVSNVLENNLTLQEEIKNQEPFLLSSFIERLLNGDIVSGSMMESMMKHLHLPPHISFVATAIVHIHPMNGSEEHRLKDLDRLRVLLKGVHRSCKIASVHFYDAAEDTLVLLFMEHHADPNECVFKMERTFEMMTNLTASEPNVSVNIAVGGIYAMLIDVSRSYGEAKQALNYLNRQQQQGIKWFHELPDLSDTHYYPNEIENQLMNNAKAGNFDEVEMLLDNIYDENFRKRNVSPSIQKLLLYEMAGSLLKLKEQLSLEDEMHVHTLLHQMIDMDNTVEVFRFMRQRYTWISKQLLLRKKSRNVQLMENIQQYIQYHYGNPNLNLDTIADHVGISRVYLSKFFKEQTNTNFSDYLESLRMEKACAMLRETEITVSEITRQSGYSSTNTFSRAFKRIHGINPTMYRDNFSE